MNDFNSDFPLYWSPLLPKLPVISGWTSRKIGLESMGQKLGVSGPIFRMNQVHGDTIVEVSPESPRVIDGADALITRHKGLALVVKTADCVPLMIWNDTGWGAVIHTGRRGTQLEITGKVLRLLEDKTDKQGLYHIWIGPHICAKCYEIDPNTHETFDMLTANQVQIEAVIPESRRRVTVFDGCTAEQTDRFFSYRKESDQAGRMFGLLEIYRR